MGYVIPALELRVEDIIALRNRALDALADAVRRAGKLAEEFQVRNILPTDLGLAADKWAFAYAAADTETNLVNTTLPDNKFVVFYGVASLSATPLTYKLVFKSKAAVKDVVQIESIYVQRDNPVGYFRDPIVFSENSSLMITGWAKAAGTDALVLIGFICEKKGESFVRE